MKTELNLSLLNGFIYTIICFEAFTYDMPLILVTSLIMAFIFVTLSIILEPLY